MNLKLSVMNFKNNNESIYIVPLNKILGKNEVLQIDVNEKLHITLNGYLFKSILYSF